MNIKAALPIASQYIEDKTVPTIDLRKIHTWLEITTRFNDWVRRRISDYDFEQSIDFIILKKEYIDSKGISRVASIEYHATLDMAKELAMVERNHKGREARKYFIACEKAVKEQRTIRIIPPQIQRYAERVATVPVKHFIEYFLCYN